MNFLLIKIQIVPFSKIVFSDISCVPIISPTVAA